MTTITPAATSTALLVKLAARHDFSTLAAMPRGSERKAAAYEAIVATARASQAPVIALAEQLEAQGAITGYQTLVSPNMLVVTPARGKTKLVAAAFQAAEGVKSLYDNENGLRLTPGKPLPTLAPGQPAKGLDVVDQPVVEVAAPTERPYGLDMIGAPAAWAEGADGHGLVFGSIDTGVDAAHENLTNYRGRQADGTVVDDYNFFDPSGKNPHAHDSDQHGSHTVGTAVGQFTGVAPKATYISAIGIMGGVDDSLRALQWMLAPTKSDGTAPDPTKAPDVVGMSWWTGSPSEDLFQESLQDLRAAGIEPVKSAGNNGPGGQSISSPGQFPELLATAAVDSRGNAPSFSSRGPAPFPPGSTTPKPDFAAPGVKVVSSLPGGRYGTMDGTSMAQPHLSGAILDILSEYPQLTHDQLVEVLKAGATDKGAVGFDPIYGNGVINIPASLKAAERLTLGAPRGH
jgi:subtilisin family serine protease